MAWRSPYNGSEGDGTPTDDQDQAYPGSWDPQINGDPAVPEFALPRDARPVNQGAGQGFYVDRGSMVGRTDNPWNTGDTNLGIFATANFASLGDTAPTYDQANVEAIFGEVLSQDDLGNLIN